MIKSLKFSEELVPLIVSGSKTKTWRLNDDKQLEVGDEIQFINSSTGTIFGYGVIEQVAAKRIIDLDDNDKYGHEAYENDQQILKEFRKYYGQSVTEQSIVKVVKYKFGKSKLAVYDVTNTTNLIEVKLFCDGGSRGNPGPSALGYVILTLEDSVVKKDGKYLGITTNNQAEYQAVLRGLKECKRLGASKVQVFLDSLLVVNQMNGVYKIKNRDLWPIHQAVKDLSNTFKLVTFIHIPREMNRIADSEVNRILDEVNKDGIGSELL